MRRIAITATVFLSLIGNARAGSDELAPEIAARLADRATLEAGLPTGPSLYRNWRSPKFAPWTFAYVGSTRYDGWSAAALKHLREVVEPRWERAGLSEKLVTPSAAADDAEASRQIRSLADQGVDVVLVCCATPTGLNEAVRHAHEKGALIVTLFGFSTSPYAINTTTDAYLAGDDLVDRIAEELDEKGNVLVVGGFLGPTASDALGRGVNNGFSRYKNLRKVGDLAFHGGAEAARAAVKAWLATHRDPVDGVILRAGADVGVLDVFAEAGRKRPFLTIGGDIAALCFWRHNPEVNGKDFLQKALVTWPPGDEAALAFNVAMRTLQGQGPKTQTIFVSPVWLSFHDLSYDVPETCHEDDDGWFSVGPESWGGVLELNSFFVKPADPSAFKR
jgi:ribose transport system substrate-binding protein